jgi:hypothetical protein
LCVLFAVFMVSHDKLTNVRYVSRNIQTVLVIGLRLLHDYDVILQNVERDT